MSIKSTERRSKHQILVSSTGRSGTRYMAEALRTIGLDVGHESFYFDGVVSYYLADRTRHWMNKVHQYPSPMWFHQVRDPLAVIRSWTEIFTDDPKRNTSSIPEIKQNDTPFIKAIKWWFYWNRCAETFDIAHRYKIEDLEEELKTICDLIGYEYSDEYLIKVKQIDKKIRSDNPVTWDTIQEVVPSEFYDRLRNLAAKYSY